MVTRRVVLKEGCLVVEVGLLCALEVIMCWYCSISEEEQNVPYTVPYTAVSGSTNYEAGVPHTHTSFSTATVANSRRLEARQAPRGAVLQKLVRF